MKRSKLFLQFATFASLLMISLGAIARESGELVVTLINATNQRPVPDATILITSRGDNTVQAKTDDKGEARKGELDGGLYNILVTHPNFIASRVSSLRILNNKATPLRIELRPSENLLEETLVIASQRSVDILSSAGASYLDREELRSAVGSGSDVLRALDGLPGLFSSGEFSSYTVRGNGPRDNLILVDGIPFDNVVHFSESFGEQEEVEGGGRFSVFAPNLISGAEFQPGGWHAAYGGKSGSLLKLEVAEGNPISPSYTSRLDIAGLEVGYDGPSRIHDDTAVLFSARRLNFGNLFEAIGLEEIGTPILADVILKTTSKIDEQNKLNFLMIYSTEEYERNLENALASDEDDPGNWEDLELVTAERDSHLFALSWSRLFGADADWTNRIYYRILDESSQTGEAYPDLVPLGSALSDIPITENIIAATREERELGFHSDFKSSNGLGRYDLGMQISRIDLDYALNLNQDEWILYTYNQNDFRPDVNQRYIVLTPDTVNNSFEEARTNVALYADQFLEYTDWDFRLGVRYERDDLSQENLFSPRIGANYLINNNWRVSFTAGTYYQSPRNSDRARDSANENLENEKVNQLSIGFKYYPNADYEILFEPYYQQLRNLVVETDGVNQTSANTGQGTSAGFDTAIIRRFKNGWSANFTYSYNQSEIRDRVGEAYYDTDFNRPHAVGIGGAWEINDLWKLSARWKWASGTPRDEYVVNENVLGDGEPLRYSREITSTNSDRYGSYSSLNFRADYRRVFGSTNVIAFIDIINVLGSENPGSSDFNPRTGEDNAEEGEATPLFGFRLEW